MSSTSTELSPAYSASLSSSDNALRIKLIIYGIFGCVSIIQSLYFVLSYATFDFFGARYSPFFGWLRELSLIMQVLYFPLLCAALVSIGMGDEKKEKVRRLAGMLVITQLVIGAVLVCYPPLGFWGSALLFGPTVETLLGFVEPYPLAVIGLIPVAWISVIHVKASIRSCAGRGKVDNKLKLSSFLLAALTSSVLYLWAARLRLGNADHQFALSALLISLVSHLAVFAFIFVALQWIRVVANRFSNPGLVQFVLRATLAWGLVAVFIRKIVFGLLSFNDHLATLYAGWFSLVIVFFAALLSLRIKELRGRSNQTAERPFQVWDRRLRATFALGAAIGLFYLSAIRFVTVDWEHILSCVSTLIISYLILWSFVAVRQRPRNYGLVSLVLLSLFAVGALTSLPALAEDEQRAGELERYSDYDPSFFAIQQVLKPEFPDDKYAAWYKFLSQHANIRIPVESPDFPLTQSLKHTSTKKPHIFVFVIDALRRDYLSPYNPKVTFTPAVQAFAQDSVIFSNAFSQYAGTPLADGAIFSGFQQINNIFPRPVSRLNNLQPLLKAEGYDSYISYNTQVAVLARESQNVTRIDNGRTDRLEFRGILEEIENDLLQRKNLHEPVFAFAQPTNVHNLWLAWHGGEVEITEHPGFDNKYASAVERVDKAFGQFISFLKQQGMYENSIVILTADHGESLGEMGRVSHVANLTPEVIRIPLMIHLPQNEKSRLFWDVNGFASLHDITPTLYYLLGHRPLRQDKMMGRSLFTVAGEKAPPKPDHYFLMSSYLPVFGILSGDQKSLFYVDALLGRNFYYDLERDPQALSRKMSAPIRDRYESAIREDLEAIDRFHGVIEQQLSPSAIR
jgi:hypothetical protein